MRLHKATPDAQFDYADVRPALAFVRSKAKFNIVGKFHKLLQKSASHYTVDGDTSERLMLKYYEYLYRIRYLFKVTYGENILENLDDFPVDLDPSLREYHEKIAALINAARNSSAGVTSQDRYYIHKTRPFFLAGLVFYEVTFYRAVNKVSKFDRIIGFTDIEMTEEYAAKLTLQVDSIQVLGQEMPVVLILGWEVSVRPCEFDNFARLLGITMNTRTNSSEYRYLMHGLTVGSRSLLDLVAMSDDRYAKVRRAGTRGAAKLQIFPLLDEVRSQVKSAAL